MALVKFTLEQIREKLKGTDFDQDDWVDECYRWVNSEDSTVEEWIKMRKKMESDYLELMKKPGFRDMEPMAQLLYMDENGNVSPNK